MAQEQIVPKTEPGTPAPTAGGQGRLPTMWPNMDQLRTDLQRAFDRMWQGLGGAPWFAPGGTDLAWPPRIEAWFGQIGPALDLTEGEKELRLLAELPGMDAKDVDLSISGDLLTISGEKKETVERKSENCHIAERRFGAFRRTVAIPAGVDRDRIGASFEKGILTITLPKTAEAAAQQRKIEIRPAA